MKILIINLFLMLLPFLLVYRFKNKNIKIADKRLEDTDDITIQEAKILIENTQLEIKHLYFIFKKRKEITMNFTKIDILTLVTFVALGVGFIFFTFGVLLSNEEETKKRANIYITIGTILLVISLLSFSLYAK